MKDSYADIKHKIRRLKKWEIRIRGETDDLVWNAYFDTRENRAKVRYPLERLAGMSGDEYRCVTDEFFYQVYYRLYRDCPPEADSPYPLYNPEILAALGLPPETDAAALKRRFRELAKKYHPDAGGDKSLFIELTERYNELIKN